MSDSPNNTGKPISDRASAEDDVVRYLMNEFGLAEQTVRRVIRSHGSLRVDAEVELRRRKNS